MTRNIPKRYVPRTLSKKDRSRQRKNILKSRRLYKRGVYFQRPKVSTFRSKPSKHIQKAMAMYKVDKVVPNKELAKKTGCTLKTLKDIVRKGEGAYYSSGSRPNQTAHSWAYARLASAITGGKASLVDIHLLRKGCDPRTSKALKLAEDRL